MKISKAKENILKKIRQALSNPVPVPFPQSEGTDNVFQLSQLDQEVEFAENFTKLQGKFSFCVDEKELAQQLQTLITVRKWKKVFCREADLKKILLNNGFNQFTSEYLNFCEAAITSCEFLIARTGSIVMSSAQESGRTVSVYTPVHICIAYTNQLVYDIKDGLALLKEKYQNNFPSLITFATGPSRTANIEKTLIVGVHGPKEVFCFLVETAQPEGE